MQHKASLCQKINRHCSGKNCSRIATILMQNRNFKSNSNNKNLVTCKTAQMGISRYIETQQVLSVTSMVTSPENQLLFYMQACVPCRETAACMVLSRKPL